MKSVPKHLELQITPSLTDFLRPEDKEKLFKGCKNRFCYRQIYGSVIAGFNCTQELGEVEWKEGFAPTDGVKSGRWDSFQYKLSTSSTAFLFTIRLRPEAFHFYSNFIHSSNSVQFPYHSIPIYEFSSSPFTD